MRLNQMTAITDKNYQITANYYKARHDALVLAYQKENQEDINNFMIEINKIIKDKWMKISQEAWSIYGSQGKKQAITFLKEQDLGDFNMDSKSFFASQIGFAYENFIGKEVGNILGSTISQVTGALTSKRAISGTQLEKETYIRPDVMFGMSIEIDKKDKTEQGILYAKAENGQPINIELDHTFALEEDNPITPEEALRYYLENGAQKIGGLNIKAHYAESDGKRIMNNSTLAKMINSQIVDNKYYNKDNLFLEAYTMFTLSKYLIPLFGPVTIMMIFGNKAVWLDEWLPKNRLYYSIKHPKGKAPQTEDSIIRNKQLASHIQEIQKIRKNPKQKKLKCKVNSKLT